MTKPKCKHTAPRGWEPRTKKRWQDKNDVWREGNQCPTYLLNQGRQCQHSGKDDFPHYCGSHSMPVEDNAKGLCKQCVRSHRGDVEVVKVTNGKSQAEVEANTQVQFDMAISKYITLRAAILRILDNDREALVSLMGAVGAGEQMIEDGQKSAGQKIVDRAQAGFTASLFEAIAAEGAE